MKLHRLEAQQELPISLDKAWAFFSDPRNLSKITPPELNLVPDSPLPSEMYPGMIISYKVRLAPLVMTTWVTEITHVKQLSYFVDEQRFGPYQFWHHQHQFTEAEFGVVATDLIHYALPFDPFSRPMHGLLVRAQLDRIFSFRREALKKHFPMQESKSI